MRNATQQNETTLKTERLSGTLAVLYVCCETHECQGFAIEAAGDVNQCKTCHEAN